MRIAFRTDASAQIGSGHAMRCLTLADALKKRGAQTVFVSRILPPALKQQIGNHGHELLLLEERHAIAGSGDLAHSDWLGVPQEIDAADTRRALGERGLDWIIVDHYALDRRWESALRPATARMMVIDDLADRAHDCDLLLDQNLVADKDTRYLRLIPGHAVSLLGPTFALLQQEYADLSSVRTKNRLGLPSRIFVYFGAADLRNMSGLTLQAFRQINRDDVILDMVVGPSNKWRNDLVRSADLRENVNIHCQQKSLVALMSEADISIGAAGATSWERLCLCLPSLVITLAENQVPIATALHENNLAKWIGNANDMDIDLMKSELSRNLEISPATWFNSALASEIDGEGVSRVIEALHV